MPEATLSIPAHVYLWLALDTRPFWLCLECGLDAPMQTGPIHMMDEDNVQRCRGDQLVLVYGPNTEAILNRPQQKHGSRPPVFLPPLSMTLDGFRAEYLKDPSMAAIPPDRLDQIERLLQSIASGHTH